MATSGSTDFSVKRDVLVKDSLIDLGAISPEDTPVDAVISHGVRLLNMMLKAWTADGLHLWKIKPFTLLLENGQSSYSLSSTGDNASFSMNSTTVKVAGVTSDTSLDVTTTSGMTVADIICVELDDGTLHETTVSSVTDSDTVVLTTGLASAAAVGNRVYWYTSKIPRPISVSDITLRDSSNKDVPVRLISRMQYYGLSDKTSAGNPVEAYFDPQLTSTKLYVYNVPDFVDKTLEIVGYFPIEDMDTASNDFDIPQEWYLAVKTNLALLLAPAYGARPETVRILQQLAAIEKDRVMGWDKEKTSVFIQPEIR